MSNQNQQIFVPVEPLSEYNVAEILYDGQEILEKPPNPSEYFQRIVNRIDFDEILDGSFDSKDNEESGPKFKKSVKSSENKVVIPFEKAKRSVLAGLTEVCALIDILAVAKEKHYMVVEPVYSEPIEHRSEISLSGKRSALAKASAILLNGSERFRKRMSEMADARNAKHSYHNDLLSLRRKFRLKLFANGIVGDYSLRSIGSRYPEGGHFEVTEHDNAEFTKDSLDLYCSRLILPVEEMCESNLTVDIIEEASQNTLLNIVLQDPRTISNDLASGPRLTAEPAGDSSSRNLCNRSFSLLYEVRRSLMMREIFYQLCQEVNHSTSQHTNQKQHSLGVSVVQNNIVATLFPGIQIIVKLVQSPRGSSSNLCKKSAQTSSSGVSSLVGGLLNQLSVIYRYNQAASMNVENLWCDCVSNNKSANSIRKQAGPLQLSTKQTAHLNDLVSHHSMLKTFLDHCRHYWLRQKVQECIKILAKSTSDPVVTYHWNVSNSYRESCVIVELVTSGYEYIKTFISITVLTQSLTLYLSGNNSHITIGYDLKELERIIQYQITCHHFNTFRRVLQRSMWMCLASNLHSGIGTSHELGTNPAVLLYVSPNNRRVFCVRGGGNHQTCKIQFFIKDSDTQDKIEDLTETSELLNRNSDPCTHKFYEVNLTRIHERSLVAKLESLINVYTDL